VLLDASVGATSGRSTPPSLAGSRWAVDLHDHRNGTLPQLDLVGHRRLVEFVSQLVAEAVAGGSDVGGGGDGNGEGPVVSGIHDVSGGGLGVALAELAVRSGFGLRVAGVADHHELFTEAPSRVVVCTTRRNELISRAAEAGVAFRVLGTAGGDRLVVEAWSIWTSTRSRRRGVTACPRGWTR